MRYSKMSLDWMAFESRTFLAPGARLFSSVVVARPLRGSEGTVAL